MVYNWKSHKSWKIRGYPHFRKPPDHGNWLENIMAYRMEVGAPWNEHSKFKGMVLVGYGMVGSSQFWIWVFSTWDKWESQLTFIFFGNGGFGSCKWEGATGFLSRFSERSDLPAIAIHHRSWNERVQLDTAFRQFRLALSMQNPGHSKIALHRFQRCQVSAGG